MHKGNVLEGLILHEDTEYVTYLCPIFDALGDELICSLNWRIISPECGSSVTDKYSFEGEYDSWISGTELVKEVRKYPNIQWWWGLLQGFPDSISRDEVFKLDAIDIKEDAQLWEYPVAMRDPNALIEIEAFDSSLTIVVAKDNSILESLKNAFPNNELLSEYNKSLIDKGKIYKLKFMFDWGSGVCLWSANKAAKDKFGDYPIDTSELPISQRLKEKLDQLIEMHDEALNWDDPAGELLWDNGQINEFLAMAKKCYFALCDELGEEYEIESIEHM